MTRQRALIAGLVLTALVVITGLLLIPRLGAKPVLTGYIEGEPLYLAAPVAGRVTAMDVVRGQTVAAGARLFVIDPQQVAATRDQAAADVAAAQAQAVDARKGQRPVELAVFDANIAAADARLREAAATLRRTSTLNAQGYASRAALDDARAAERTAQAALTAARRQRDAAALGGREDQIRAAEARVSAAQAGLTGATARVSDVAPVAPAAARVEEVFFQQGEWAPANQPILSLLPDNRIKVRFFVPERSRAAYPMGAVIRFSCDGCAAGMTAKINYISPRPEFTPPVIYSREARDRLVYLVEALPSVRLNPGQPVDVEPRQ